MYLFKFIKKTLYSILKNKFHLLLLLLVVLIIMCCSHVGEILNKFHKSESLKLCDEKIDVVYTWVNGSDEKFRENIQKYLNKDVQKVADYSNERFDDKYELKFSLRSLEKFAPWVNHVWIVTNGQIPHWLDLDYEKVTVVTHEDIFQDLENLPTFSSPAIETNLHRIQGLSPRFLYLNDDTFLGAPVFPQDFWSAGRGFLVYLAWALPPCAPGCPWLYVADGQCDSACRNSQCQLDGGDCEPGSSNQLNSHIYSHHDYEDDDFNAEYEYYEQNQLIIKRELLNRENKTSNNKTLLGYVHITSNNTTIHKNSVAMTTGDKTNKLHMPNNKTNVLQLVKQYNQQILLNDKILRRKKMFRSRKKFFNSTMRHNNSTTDQNGGLDTYALSLQHTNRVFNLNYGYKQRKVPAHAPILIDVEVMNQMQRKFEKEIHRTEKNRFRSPEDFQFSFSYYYYLMNEKIQVDMGRIFDEFDTDNSGTWSDREIRTILTKINDLPLNYGMLESFDNAILNCSKHMQVPDVPVPLYERYQDSKLPVVSKELILNCPKIVTMLEPQFAVRSKYNFEVIKNAQGQYVMFKMLTSNVSDVVGHLDEVRKEPRKFVCLNDNMSWKQKEDNELVKAILLDLYLSLFPTPSRFELSQEYRNRFAYMHDLLKWRAYHSKVNICLVVAIVVFTGLTTHHICKRRLTRRLNKIIYF